MQGPGQQQQHVNIRMEYIVKAAPIENLKYGDCGSVKSGKSSQLNVAFISFIKCNMFAWFLWNLFEMFVYSNFDKSNGSIGIV